MRAVLNGEKHTGTVVCAGCRPALLLLVLLVTNFFHLLRLRPPARGLSAFVLASSTLDSAAVVAFCSS
jgi:hypothetical protein